MGKVTGFPRIRTRRPRLRAGRGARFATGSEFVLPLPEKDIREQAARCMNCGVPYCHGTGSITGTPGCPVNNQIPDWNDLVYQRQLGRGRAQPALDQQFPRSHRPRLPGAVRGVLHAQHRRQSGHHQNRSNARSPTAPSPTAGSSPSRRRRKTGKKVAVVGSGPAGHGLRAAARARRPRRAPLREIRQGRRPDALRHSRLQDGEASRRPPRRRRWRPKA